MFRSVCNNAAVLLLYPPPPRYAHIHIPIRPDIVHIHVRASYRFITPCTVWLPTPKQNWRRNNKETDVNEVTDRKKEK